MKATKEKNKRKKLLQVYSRKPVRHVKQFDFFVKPEEDDVFRQDTDGDCIFWTKSDILQISECVRVTCPIGLSKKDVLRALSKIQVLIKRLKEEK